jgi:general secretion pathway protein D
MRVQMAFLIGAMLLSGGVQAQVGAQGPSPQNGVPATMPGASGPPQAIAPGAGDASAPRGPAHRPLTRLQRKHLKGVDRADETKDVTLNFPGVDVHEAAKAILGDILGYNYAVDPSVSGAITVVTANPVRKGDVFPLLEDSLKAANLGLVKRGAVYTIVPLAEAKRQPQLVGPIDPGYGTEAIQLHYVSATEIKKLLEPLVPENAISQVDPGRNMVLVTGSAGERSSIRELIQQFDVNALQGMSFAMFVPKHTDVKTIQPQLDQLLNGDGAPTAGLVRLLPVDRINGILAISKQPQYLKDVGRWVDMLDHESEEGSKRLFVYRVQNGKASELALVLSNAFGANSNSNNGQQGTPNKYANGLNRPPPIGTFQPQQGGSNPMGGLGGSQAGGGSSAFDRIGASNSDALGGEAPAVAGTSIQLSASGSPVTLTSDDSNNAIVVYASAREYGIIEDALKKLDTQPLQVMIEAAITEVTLTNEMQYGVQWGFGQGTITPGISQAQGAASNAVTGVSTVPGFSYLLTYGATINATLNALAGVTKLDVLSAPKLVVLNNHTAALEVGQQVPISTGSAVSTESSSAPIVNSVDYRDTGVILKVTPRVNDGGLVLLDISQEVSDVASTTSSQIDSPTINERKIASSIAVHDGQTVALGGLITRSKTDNSLGIPLLRHIPILGSTIFNNTDKEDDRTELIVLLTPHVIRSDAEAKSITQGLIDAMKSIQPLMDKKNQ